MNFTSSNHNTMKTFYITVFGIVAMAFASRPAHGQPFVNPFTTSGKYVGMRISVGMENATIKSDIAKLDKSKFSAVGGSAGLYLGNQKGFIVTTAGLYYSTESACSSVDILTANVQGGLYLLRLSSTRHHVIEPYLAVSVNDARSTFYGPARSKEGRSNGQEEKIGVINTVRTSVGLGLEFQLANRASDFVHFFAEARYGHTLLQSTSRPEFEQTSLQLPLSARVGVVVGRIK
jgi:hypothetical protein